MVDAVQKEEWRWSLTTTAGGHSNNPTSNDDETTYGQVLFCFKRHSDYKQTGQQINEHMEYGREFHCTLFWFPTCCSQVISENPPQVKHTIYADQMPVLYRQFWINKIDCRVGCGVFFCFFLFARHTTKINFQNLFSKSLRWESEYSVGWYMYMYIVFLLPNS